MNDYRSTTLALVFGFFALSFSLFAQDDLEGLGNRLKVISPTSGSSHMKAIAASEDGKLLTVGDGGAMASSSDGGVTWTQETIAYNSNGLLDVTYGAGKFLVAAGSLDFLETSDFVTWKLQTIPEFGSAAFVDFINGQFIALSGTRIATSVDGSHWQVSDNLPTSVSGITYGKNLYVAVGNNGAIYTSPDLVIWTQRDADTWDVDGLADDFSRIRFSEETFLAVGKNGLFCTSPDAVQWTRTDVGASAFIFDAFKLDGAYYVPRGGSVILKSTDLTNWDEIRVGDGTHYNFAFANGTIYSTGRSGTLTKTTDGETWEDIRGDGLPTSFSALAQSASILVGAGSNGALYSSVDGINWVMRHPDNSGSYADVQFDGAQFVAIQRNGEVLQSPDGIQWNSKPAVSMTVEGFVSNAGTWVAVGWGGKIGKSSDLGEWTVTEVGDEKRLEDVTFGAGNYVVVAYEGLIMTSPDGVQWTEVESNATGNLYGVAYGGGQFVVAGRPSLRSTDGVNWEEVQWYHTSQVHYRNDQFVGLGSSGISYSTDGIDWLTERPQTAANINGLAFVGNRWIAVGWNRTLLATDPDQRWNVFVLASGGGTIFSDVELSQPQEPGTRITFTATPDDGYILGGFQNWGDGETEESDNTLTLTVEGGDALVTADFIPTPSYTVELEIDGEGSVNTSPATDSFLHGSEVTLTAVPGPGQEFRDWQGSLRSSENPFTFVINRDLSIRARFQTIPQVDLTTTVVGEGSIVVAPQADSYLRGTELTFTAVPAEGYKFIRWSRHLTGSTNPAMLTMDGHKRVDAIFEQSTVIYTLTVMSVGQGFVQQSLTGNTHEVGTEIVLTPVASPGYRFARWTGAVGGNSSPLLLTMDGDKTINAEFEKISGYEQWVESHFTFTQRLNPSISGEASDPDKDGADNFSEFYANTNPWKRESVPQLKTSLFRLGNQNYFQLSWTRPVNREGLTERIETLIGSKFWVTDENYSDLGSQPKNDGYENVSSYRSIPISSTNNSGIARISVSR